MDIYRKQRFLFRVKFSSPWSFQKNLSSFINRWLHPFYSKQKHLYTCCCCYFLDTLNTVALTSLVLFYPLLQPHLVCHQTSAWLPPSPMKCKIILFMYKQRLTFTTRSLLGPAPTVPGILIRLHSDLNTKPTCCEQYRTQKKRSREGRVAKVVLVSLDAFGASGRSSSARVKRETNEKLPSRIITHM